MPVHSILNYKKSLCLALLIAPFMGHNAAFGQVLSGGMSLLNPHNLERSRDEKLTPKERLLDGIKSRNENMREWALAMLSNGSYKLPADEAIPLYTELLRIDLPATASPQERIDLDDFNGRLADALTAFKENSRPALPKLLALVNATDHSTTARFRALSALKSIAPHDPAVVKCYIDLLKTGDMHYESYLINELFDLTRSGVNIDEATPLIRKLTGSVDTQLATVAFYALGHMEQAKQKRNVPNLKRALYDLKHFQGSSVEQKASTLIGITTEAHFVQNEKRAKLKTASPLLWKLFQTEKSPPVKAAILDTLGLIKTGYDAASIRLLLNAVTDDDLRNSAAGALFSGIANSNAKAIAFLVAALYPERHPLLFSATEQQALATGQVKLAIIRALTQLGESAGPAALPVAEILREAMNGQSNYYELFEPCIWLLSATGAAGSESAPIVLEILQIMADNTKSKLPNDAYGRSNYRISLLKVASRFKISDEKLQQTALDIAIAGLKHDQGAVYIESAKLAGSLGGHASAALPYLLSALAADYQDIPLQTPYSMVSEADFFGMKRGALESIIFEQVIKKENPGEKVAIDENDQFRLRTSHRLEAMRTIGKIGLPAAAPAIPLLEKWTKETAPPLYRLIAGDALKRLKGEQVSTSTLN